MPKARDTIERKIYFDRKEWEEICRRAEIAGKKPHKFIREMSVFSEVKFYDFKEYMTLVYELRSIGENINQIVRVVNSTGSIYEKDIKDIKSEFTRLEGMFENYFSDIMYSLIE